MRFRDCSLALPAAMLLSACGSLELSAIHDPLYSPTPHTSTITAHAVASKGGVKEIEIDVIEGEITACTELYVGAAPSIIPCRMNAFTSSHICTFANVTTPVDCAVSLNLGDRRLVTYTAKATTANGNTASTSAITYAGGAPLTQTMVQILPGFGVPMAWETARPVWWQTGSAGGAAAKDKIDLGFFPDSSFNGKYADFTNGLQKILTGTFWNTTDRFAITYTTYRESFNFWAGPEGAGALDCVRSIGGSAATVAAAADGKPILHSNTFRDCSDLALGGAASIQTTLPDVAFALTHESGHFLNGMADEYPTGGLNSISDPRNTYASQADCKTAATSLSIDANDCAQIGTSGVWFMNDGNAAIMKDRLSISDWRTASGVVVAKRFSKCNAGSCY
jgi:hypothetical protein